MNLDQGHEEIIDCVGAWNLVYRALADLPE
jgi:hypothetical protein